MKKTLLIIVFLSILIAGWFYWFSWRPAQARKTCAGKVRKRIDEPGELTIKEAQQTYSFCLIEHGMEREDLVKL